MAPTPPLDRAPQYAPGHVPEPVAPQRNPPSRDWAAPPPSAASPASWSGAAARPSPSSSASAACTPSSQAHPDQASATDQGPDGGPRPRSDASELFGPAWEAPRRYEAYPTLRTRVGLPS